MPFLWVNSRFFHATHACFREVERNGPEDRVKAVDLLDETLAISSELGMR